MSAKKGWMQSARLLGCLMVVAMIGSAVLASVASAKTTPTPTAYVALGDSLSFGYKAKTFNQNQVANKAHCEAAVAAAEASETELAYAEKALCEPASSFEGGFVGGFAKKLASAEKKAGHALTTVNLGCPGETSDGLIGHMLGNESAEADPCAYHNELPEQGFPLKTEFGHTASQLEAAANLIGTKAAGEVTAVSLQIGSNDELHVVHKCETPAYDIEHGFPSLTACIVHEAGPEGFAYEGGLFHHILVNIGTAIGVLRSETVKYGGRILVLGFYNPDATVLPGSDALVKILNENLEKTIGEGKFGPGIVLAQPFTLINPEAGAEPKEEKEANKDLKKEESAICKYTEMCNGGKIPSASGDIHPTEKGYKKVAKLMEEAWGL